MTDAETYSKTTDDELVILATNLEQYASTHTDPTALYKAHTAQRIRLELNRRANGV